LYSETKNAYLPIPLAAQIPAREASTASFSRQKKKQQKTDLSNTDKKKRKQTCFLQRQITQNTNKFITKQGKERGRRLLSLSNTLNVSL